VRRGGHRTGFTLVELLAAMALLAVLGSLLMQLSRNAFDIYASGDRRADLYQAALGILDRIEDDVTATSGGRDGRFLLVRRVPGEEGRAGDDGFLLKLVRTVPGGELQHPHLRYAGTTAKPELSWTGGDPGAEQRGKVAPPSGMMEVAYALIHDEDDPDGVMTLYRGVRAPAHAPGGFFDGAAAALDDDWVRKNLKPVAKGVLGLWILCYGQETADWQEQDSLDGRRVKDGSLAVWDSTRGILPKRDFPLARGPASRGDSRDDVYPRRVRVLVHVARSWSPEARLVEGLAADGHALVLNDPRAFPPDVEEERHCVKVGWEWLRLEGVDGSFADVTRGVRGTAARAGAHVAGMDVFVGRLFRKTLEFPVRRSIWTRSDI